MTEIPVERPPDLAHQERLTRTLMNCHPVYEPIPTDEPQWLRAIERHLEVPVGTTSNGPTADEKRVLIPLAQ